MKPGYVPEVIWKGSVKYRRAGSFTTSEEAKRYARKLRTLYRKTFVKMITAHEQMGYNVRWHVYEES